MVFAIHSHESAMGAHVSPILKPLTPSSPSHPSGSSQCTSPEHPVSCMEPGLAICFTYDNIHVSVLLSQIIPPSPSPAESKRLFYTSVSLLNSQSFLNFSTSSQIPFTELFLKTRIQSNTMHSITLLNPRSFFNL